MGKFFTTCARELLALAPVLYYTHTLGLCNEHSTCKVQRLLFYHTGIFIFRSLRVKITPGRSWAIDSQAPFCSARLLGSSRPSGSLLLKGSYHKTSVTNDIDSDLGPRPVRGVSWGFLTLLRLFGVPYEARADTEYGYAQGKVDVLSFSSGPRKRVSQVGEKTCRILKGWGDGPQASHHSIQHQSLDANYRQCNLAAAFQDILYAITVAIMGVR